VNVAALAALSPGGCKMEGGCGACPLADAKVERAGLLWIGEKFYPTPGAWEKEAREMGISRRIKAIPRGFKIGETWIALAHIKATNYTPGIFRLFRPTAIEYVVKGTETETELEDMEKRGISLVKVEHAPEQAAA
jgi:hypothetical protein